MSAAQDASSLLNMGTTKKYDIPLAHLDYKYIEECNDVKYLEKILRILRWAYGFLFTLDSILFTCYFFIS